jgi:hypothetical protein
MNNVLRFSPCLHVPVKDLGSSIEKKAFPSQSRQDAKKSSENGFFAPSRLRESSGFWIGRKLSALTKARSHGRTTKADGPAFFRASAAPRENGVSSGKNPMFSRRRRDAEKTR